MHFTAADHSKTEWPCRETNPKAPRRLISFTHLLDDLMQLHAKTSPYVVLACVFLIEAVILFPGSGAILICSSRGLNCTIAL